jgi:hypothetical protein
MITEKFKEILSLEREIDEKNSAVKILDEKMRNLVSSLVEDMDAENITEITVEGKEFKRDVITAFTIDSHKWDDPMFFDWLKAHDMGDVIRMKEEVHAQTRGKILREWVEEGNALPDFIKQSFFNTVKWK